MCLLVYVYQQSLSEVGDDGLLSGCWVFFVVVWFFGKTMLAGAVLQYLQFGQQSC